MDERKKKKRRATLSDYKTDYAVEGQFKLDMTLIPRKKSKQPDMMKNTRTTASTDEPCCSTSRGQTFEIPVDISDTGVIDKNTCSTVVFDLPEISAVEKYRRLLIDNDAFLVWDEQMTTFIILDYNSESNTLKNVPQLVSRSSRQLFTCMCDEERMNFVDNFGTGDVKDGQIQEISFLENHFVVYTKGSFSIVKVIFGQLKCLFCNGKIECQHLKFVDKLLNKYEHIDLPEVLDRIYGKLEKHKDRVFIKDKTTRDIMLLFCKKDAMFEHNDFLRMKKQGCIQSCPEEYRDFIRMLSCNSPVCAAIPYGQLDNIKYIIDNKNFRKNLQIMKSIQGAVPVLFNLICAVPDLPQFIRDILSAVVDIITKTFILDEHKTSSNVTQDALAYFPNLQKIRCRGLYAMDKKGDEKVCTKKGSHPSLLPGIFTVFCPHVPPTAIIYDNACNLQQYCLNRDPGFLKKTGCAVSYKGLLYPEIQNINTQLVEQNNAKLKKLKPSLSYMKAENFMKSVTFFEWHCNQQLKD
ncbi:unnamed protein product [Mytilus edulis]|uniref:Uncharacterized protein n=1 Tax=Mytilus edulis TaxID=6550 RepID=A0A8S3SGH1_MYTED|nr:unnamed protein product [Mytilus edulis]